jgi:transcription-repair coupling factor (superfamily II helicase)
VDTRIPDDYIADTGQRLRTYKRIASARSDEELARIRDELADRYGRLPDAVGNLFEYARLRREAEHLGLVSIDRVGQNLSIKLGEKAKIEPDRLLNLLAETGNASFTPTGVLKLKISAELDKAIFTELRETLRRLQAA